MSCALCCIALAAVAVVDIGDPIFEVLSLQAPGPLEAVLPATVGELHSWHRAEAHLFSLKMTWLSELLLKRRVWATLTSLVWVSYLLYTPSPVAPVQHCRSQPAAAVTPKSVQPTSYASHKAFFFTFADGNYVTAMNRLMKEARATEAFDDVWGYTLDDIPGDYFAQHERILNASRGAGYWMWKPYFLRQIFNRISDGDIVMYADAGCEFTGRPQIYIDIAKHYGFLGFKLPLPMHAVQRWTKGDIWDALGMEMDTWGIEKQHVGGIWLIQKNPKNEMFLDEWLKHAENYQLISDAPSISPSHPDFQENRHDQAIYSLLVYKHGMQLILEDRTFPRELSKVIHAARRRD